MSIIREDKSNTQDAMLFPPAKVEATQDAIASLDISGFDSVLITASFGASDVNLAGDNSIQIEVEHSDNDADFEPCSDSDIINAVEGENAGTFANIDAEIPAEGLCFSVAYKGYKRYIRAVIRCTGGDHGVDDHGTLIGITACLRGTKYRPVTA